MIPTLIAASVSTRADSLPALGGVSTFETTCLTKRKGLRAAFVIELDPP